MLSTFYMLKANKQFSLFNFNNHKPPTYTASTITNATIATTKSLVFLGQVLESLCPICDTHTYTAKQWNFCSLGCCCNQHLPDVPLGLVQYEARSIHFKFVASCQFIYI